MVALGFTLDLSAQSQHCHDAADHCGHALENKNRSVDYMTPVLAVGRFLDDHGNAVNAFASVIIAAFTIVLALTTRGLSRATRGLQTFAAVQADDMKESIAASNRLADSAGKSASVAEKALVDAERPYVFVVGVATPKLLDRNEDGEYFSYIQYTAANYGRTPAIIEEARAGLMLSKTRKLFLPLTVYEHNPLFVFPIIAPRKKRGPIRFEIVLANNADADNPEDNLTTIKAVPLESDDEERIATLLIPKDAGRLYFRVVIKYRGPFTYGHETAVCWSYFSGGFDYFED